MKSTGIVKKVDEFGRIVVPIELRRKLDIDIKGSIEFFVQDQNVMLRKYTSGCSHCGLSGAVFELGNIKLCEACRDFCTGFAVSYFGGESSDFGLFTFLHKLGREKCHCHNK